MQPVRHWPEYAVSGFVLAVFSQKFLSSLKQFFCKNPEKHQKFSLIFDIHYTLSRFFARNPDNFPFFPELHTLFSDFIKKHGRMELTGNGETLTGKPGLCQKSVSIG
jgi:hypothetical protein